MNHGSEPRKLTSSLDPLMQAGHPLTFEAFAVLAQPGGHARASEGVRSGREAPIRDTAASAGGHPPSAPPFAA